MKTKIYEINQQNLIEISQIIKEGGLVAIPTETVYGLACNGLNPEAIRKVFDAKNRPMDNPLILHISRLDQIHDLVSDISDDHLIILEKLWPGPLTVVLNKSEIIPDEITAGLDSVAIRMPDSDITRELISLVGSPLSAPSANLSTKPSPTNAKDVFEDMNGRIDAILDGGSSSIGIESTVLDLTGDTPKILRPGYYTKEMLEEYFGEVEFDLALRNNDATPKSPGQKYKHYAPNAEILVLIGSNDSFIAETKEILSRNSNVGLMIFDEDISDFETKKIINMGSQKDLSTMAKILFESFRQMDDNNIELIVVHGVEEEGFGLSIMNRLKKAASNNIRRI